MGDTGREGRAGCMKAILLMGERWEDVAMADKFGNASVFLMKYQDLSAKLKGEYTGVRWGKERLGRFDSWRQRFFVNGVLRFDDEQEFRDVWGKDLEEFNRIVEGRPVNEARAVDAMQMRRRKKERDLNDFPHEACSPLT